MSWIKHFGMIKFVSILLLLLCILPINLQAQDNDKLMRDLRSKDPHIRINAANKLGIKATQELITIFQDKNENIYIRVFAIKNLSRLHAKEAIPALIKALDDEINHIRYSSAITLGFIEAKESIPKLIKMLKDETDIEVRNGVAYALGSLKAEEAIPELIFALRHDEDLRCNAAWALGAIKAKEAINDLIEALKDLSPNSLSCVVKALEDLEAKEAIPELTRLLNNKYVDEYSEIYQEISKTLNKLKASN